MNIKSLLLGSAAALVAVSGARAADAVVVAEPEPVEYVRVCDTYGAGFFYIPGTETCLKISGYVRYDAVAGDDPYNGAELGTWAKQARATVRFDARSETELGTLRSFIETRFDHKAYGGNDDNGVDDAGSYYSNGGYISHAYIELGGFRVGVSDSLYDTWTGSAGNVITDDAIAYAGGRTNQISYTFAGGNGFSALIGLEQGDSSHLIEDYMPHVVAGVKFEQAWGGISAVAAYDSVVEEFAGKVRLDVKFTDTVSGFIMGGYQSNEDDFDVVSEGGNYYGSWNGDYAIWGGLSAKVSEKATVNFQAAYEEQGTFAAALNVNYEIVPGFVITPEVNYASFDEDRGSGDDAFTGIVRFQRNF
ncbi:porin [Phyllobacterium sp. YR531]|uniref:porin n=1 Tax=Phyllobacterium sp. YR531 TaxID=1144343 RepID=UPI00026F75EC|nr:porin [Phyllobacterium sp. YR531]EJM98868.1 Porin subfamily [Phyllobacterium sp. YR531]